MAAPLRSAPSDAARFRPVRLPGSGKRVVLAALILALLTTGLVPAAVAAEGQRPIPPPPDPRRPVDLTAKLHQEVAQRVLVPFRVWNRRKSRYVTDPAAFDLGKFVVRERIPSGEESPGSSRFVAQEVLTLDRDERPLSLALVVDVSGSMAAAMPSVRRAAEGLVERLEPHDRVAILAFNEDAVLVSDLTSDRAAIRAALLGLYPRGFTGLYDGIAAGFRRLRHEGDPRAIVVLTDGVDNRSSTHLDQIVAEARRAGIPFFCVYHRVSQRAHHRLSVAAERTGGRVFTTNRDEALVDAFGTIAEGLRHTFHLAYRTTNQVFDGTFREVRARYARRGWTMQTDKRGYRALTAEEARARGEELVPGARDDRLVPVLPTLPADRVWPGEVPASVCEHGHGRLLRSWCEEGMRARPLSGEVAGLVIEGWVDLAHGRAAMVHPTRYSSTRPLPTPARKARLVSWGSSRQFGRFERLVLPLPEPRRLPESMDALLASVLRHGAVFRVMGLQRPEEPSAPPVPAEKRFAIQPVPGLGGPDAEGDRARPGVTWLDGGIALDAGETLARWMVLAQPAYLAWLRDRFEAETRTLVQREIEMLHRQAPAELAPDVWPLLERRVERSVRRERLGLWSDIAAGRRARLRHLLPWRRDLSASELMERVEGIVIDALLARPAVEPAVLERDWLAPARAAWSAFRTFLAPAGHRSLTVALPFRDRDREEIYLQRVVLPRVESTDDGGSLLGVFAPRPEALESFAELVQDPAVAEELVGGAYRCPEGCVSDWTFQPRYPDANPPEWYAEVVSIRERQAALALRREQGEEDDPRWAREERRLARESRRLRRGSGSRARLLLQRADDPAVGLRIVWRDGEAPRATPLGPTGPTLEVTDPAGFVSLPAAAATAGLEAEDPALANVLVAARLNGFRDETLRSLLGSGVVGAMLESGQVHGVRLAFLAETELMQDLLPRRMAEGDRAVLRINLTAVRHDEVRAALRDLADELRQTDPRPAPGPAREAGGSGI